jgi:hypothetical protein
LPSLLELAVEEPFSGLSEKRKGALISLDRDDLAKRIQRYLDPKLSFTTARAAKLGPVEPAGRFDPEAARARLHELVPKADAIAFLENPNNPTVEADTKDVQAAASVLGQQVHVLNAAPRLLWKEDRTVVGRGRHSRP